MKQISCRWISLVLGTILAAMPVMAQPSNDFRIGISAGIGFPKISYSSYRFPISVLAGFHAQQALGRQWMLRGEASGLTTIHFGTWSGKDSPLKFNLLWTSINGCYHLSGTIGSSSWFTAGIGAYKLDQLFGVKAAKLRTSGLNIGVLTQQSGMMNRMIFDIRWHLLFHPSPNPQVFTFTIGYLF
jgi:hypothetical protein